MALLNIFTLPLKDRGRNDKGQHLLSVYSVSGIVLSVLYILFHLILLVRLRLALLLLLLFELYFKLK